MTNPIMTAGPCIISILHSSHSDGSDAGINGLILERRHKVTGSIVQEQPQDDS